MLKVDIGCGDSKPDGFVGVDICPGANVDIVADISQTFPFEDNSVDELRAYDVIEHLPDRINTMNEIWRVCKPGAMVDLVVPSTDGRGAFQDPTHISFWNINSFRYFSVDFPAYFNLCQKYGFKGAFKIQFIQQIESPDQVIHVKVILQVVKRYFQAEAAQEIPNFTSSTVDQREALAFAQLAEIESALLKQNYSVSLAKISHVLNISHSSSVINRLTEILDQTSINQQTGMNQDTVGSANLSGLEHWIQQYRHNPTDINVKVKLRQVRDGLLAKITECSSTQLVEEFWRSHSQEYICFLNSRFQDDLCMEDEQVIVQTLTEQLEQKTLPQISTLLMRLMLYCSSDKIPVIFDLPALPSWLVDSYFDFMIQPVQVFRQIGDAERYCHHIQKWVGYLHQQIFQHREDTFWQKAAARFSGGANFIPLYFNDHNLKKIYTQRADILEWALTLDGCAIDYQFPVRSPLPKKIRLGILANCYLPSAETFATLPVYEHLSRDFEVVLYSLNYTEHPLEEYCRSRADGFRQLQGGLQEQVDRIRADNLDILYISTNITAVTNAICLLSLHRLARIQVTSGGSVVTTGFRMIDYYLSGQFTDWLETAQDQYQEKLLKVSETAQCFSYATESDSSSRQVSRSDLHIPEQAVVFTSAANMFKVLPELMLTWAKIIASVPNSVLLLFPYGPNWSNSYPKQLFETQMLRVFEEQGIEPERLIVADPQPVPNRQELREFLKLADVYLDSYPFSGTTSLIEPMEISLPMVSRRGQSFRSAMGSALLQAMDLADCVADTEQAYIQIATNLGMNAAHRQALCERIREALKLTPSFLDSRRYAQQIETAFHQLVDIHQDATLKQQYPVRQSNLIAFPDWQQSEDDLFGDLVNLLRSVVSDTRWQDTSLFIYIGSFDGEAADMMISSVLMHLVMEEGIDGAENSPEITLIDHPDAVVELKPYLTGKWSFRLENQEAIAQTSIGQLNLPHVNVELVSL